MVFRATRKSMLKVIQGTSKSMPNFGDQYFGNLGFEQNLSTKLGEKKKCYLNKRIDWEHILE